MKRQVEDSSHIILCDQIYHLRRNLSFHIAAKKTHSCTSTFAASVSPSATRYITNTVYLDGNASRVADTLARIRKTPDGLSETLQYRSIGK